MSENVRVFTKEGHEGNLLDPFVDHSSRRLRIALNSGRVIEVSPSALRGRSPDSYWLDLDLTEEIADVRSAATEERSAATEERSVATEEEVVAPVLAEELHVDTQPVTTGGVRVNRIVHHHDEAVDIPLMKQDVDVKRVKIDREVEGPLSVRYEGDVTIIPIVEEEILISKRYVLKEEVHITRTTREEVHHERVTLRRQEPVIERMQADGTSETIDVPLPRR
jgi:uncharacterized protein (TIGR02271 family)